MAINTRPRVPSLELVDHVPVAVVGGLIGDTVANVSFVFPPHVVRCGLENPFVAHAPLVVASRPFWSPPVIREKPYKNSPCRSSEFQNLPYLSIFEKSSTLTCRAATQYVGHLCSTKHTNLTRPAVDLFRICPRWQCQRACIGQISQVQPTPLYCLCSKST